MCFVLGVFLGGSAIYVLEHLTEVGRPIYVGIFAAAALTALGVVDRVVSRRLPPRDSYRTGTRRSR
ncbi:hypothetical protein AB0K51_15505 [Kitasatospora sp. NPDC049285]|uniref:hypothetical protein n=1 Tax=Kitasatospora sp. NPDC049285 TaxID=3157096 RepID=UPI00341A5025